MTYNQLIPIPTDNLSNSQGQFLANFGQLNTQFGVDHSPFNTGSGNGTGFHQKVTMPGSVSTPTPAAGFGNMYANTAASVTTPYWIRDGLAAIFSMLPIKAFGVFDGTIPGGPTATINALNLSCTSFAVGTGYVMAMPANTVIWSSSPKVSYGVIAIAGQTGLAPAVTAMYAPPTSATVFSVGFRNAAGTIVSVDQYSVIVFQL